MARSTALPISVSRRGSGDGDADHTVVWLRGEHDLATKRPLALAITRAAERDDADLLVDLSGVTFMDASTIGVIVGSANRLRSRSLALAVRDPSPWILRLLGVCQLAHLVQPLTGRGVHPSGAAAALGTWVDVPPSDSAGPRPDRRTAATQARRAEDEPSRTTLATTDAGADRRYP